VGWREEGRCESSRFVAGGCGRAAASSAAGAACAAAAGAAWSVAGATTASSVAASTDAAPSAAAALSGDRGVVRGQMSVDTSRLGRRSARAGGPGVETAESKSVEPRRHRQFLEVRRRVDVAK